jgi:NADH:ubiquinone oxidoreductase subunit C
MRPLEEIKQDIEAKILGVQIAIEGTSLLVPKDRWLEAARFLKEDSDYNLNYLSSVTGVDYKEYLEVVYHLYSIPPSPEKKGSGLEVTRPDPFFSGERALSIKVRTDLQTCEIPSVTPIWRSAEFQEREAYDLVGIKFAGHPDLRRILMWDEFKFHPLRKDYVQENQDRQI